MVEHVLLVILELEVLEELGGGGDGGDCDHNVSQATMVAMAQQITGGGGGGSGISNNAAFSSTFDTTASGGNGGSGIVIIKFPDTYTITIGSGLTRAITTAGGFKIVQFTAGTDTITFS